MAIAAIILIIVAGFAVSAYLYNVGGRKKCARCGSLRTYVHIGLAAVGPIYNCRECGAVFRADGTPASGDSF